MLCYCCSVGDVARYFIRSSALDWIFADSEICYLRAKNDFCPRELLLSAIFFSSRAAHYPACCAISPELKWKFFRNYVSLSNRNRVTSRLLQRVHFVYYSFLPFFWHFFFFPLNLCLSRPLYLSHNSRLVMILSGSFSRLIEKLFRN